MRATLYFGRFYILCGFLGTCSLLSALSMEAATPTVNILVQVVDEETEAPISGVEVIWRITGHSDANIRVQGNPKLTNEHGLALLVVDLVENSSRRQDSRYLEPFFEYKIMSDQYRCAETHYPWILEDILPRPSAETPKTPDIIVTISSEQTKVRRQEEEARLDAEMEANAAKVINEQPDYWPPDEPTDRLGYLIVKKRWEIAKASEIELPDETESIKQAVQLDAGSHKKMEVSLIKFIDENTAMLEASWHTSGLNAGGYTMVVERKDGQWRIIRRYLMWVA